METLILVLHVLAALCVIGLVLLQHGKGADMGAAFGSGSAGSLFGSSGSANFLSRTTAVLAAVFFLTSLGLTYVSSHKGQAERRDVDAPGSAGRTRRRRFRRQQPGCRRPAAGRFEGERSTEVTAKRAERGYELQRISLAPAPHECADVVKLVDTPS